MPPAVTPERAHSSSRPRFGGRARQMYAATTRPGGFRKRARSARPNRSVTAIHVVPADFIARSSNRLGTALTSGHERVHCSDSPIQAIVLEVFRDDFREPVVVGIRPEVGVEPAQLVGCTSSNCVADNR